jgi:hypothetical protein
MTAMRHLEQRRLGGAAAPERRRRRLARGRAEADLTGESR